MGLSPAALTLVVPDGGGVGAAGPSGGDVWDRQVRDALRARGWTVSWCPVVGTWPRPTPTAAAALDAQLARLPDATAVLLDGLVACGVPDVVSRHTARLRTGVVVHLPLALETGLDPAVAARLARAEAAVLRSVDVVVVTSRWTAALLAPLELRRAPVVASPGTSPPPDHAVPPRHDGDGGGNLLCVATVSRRKGQQVLVGALAGLRDRRWRLRLVGPQPDRHEVDVIAADVERAGLGDRVTLTGPLLGEHLEQQWRWADLLVLPSHVETFGMVVTEALARGVPVLATNGSGVPEALGSTATGAPGLLVPPGDGPALATALRDWLDDGTLRSALTGRARVRGRQLPGWDGTAAAVAGAFAA